MNNNSFALFQISFYTIIKSIKNLFSLLFMATSMICSLCDSTIDIYHTTLLIARFMCGHSTHGECYYARDEAEQNTCQACGEVSTSVTLE